MKRVIRLISRNGVALVAFALIAGCGSGGTVTTVVTSAPTAPAANAFDPAHPGASRLAGKPQMFSGVGTENLGTITVPDDSTLRWSCPSCSGGNFQILTSDGTSIDVNGLDQTSGVTVISADTYHGVSVNTEGQNWAFTITPGNSTQTPQAPPAVPDQASPAQPGAQGQTSSRPGSNTACDTNISAGPGTSCPFAENVFRAYAIDFQTKGQQSNNTIDVTSPVTRQSYSVTCTNDGVTVNCSGGNNGFVTFPFRAVQVY